MFRALTGLLFFLFYLPAFSQDAYWQQQVNYTINVELNDKDHSLNGAEKIEYINSSPDTLHFIWFHVWPNAYKNDKTALSDQLLEEGNTSFYFGDENYRGYINRLAFKVNGTLAVMEDHPQHQDIIKIVLPSPLAPHQSCLIETPFHVKLPYNFSRGGHIGQSYQITQWYPKAAVYDKTGWHEMPYLDIGEFYNDFGNYEVTITTPQKYIVAAPGEIINNNSNQNSITYRQNNATDFAWFADKKFTVAKDTLLLPSGKIIDVAAYTLPDDKNPYWKNAVKYIKKTVLTRSKLIGEYPYQNVTVVQGPMKYGGGMEYPAITVLSGVTSDHSLESLIEHEVGHNWFQAVLATNERDHAWMDEGMNTYYQSRYEFEPVKEKITKKGNKDFVKDRMPENFNVFVSNVLSAEKNDQPIDMPSDKMSFANYGQNAYYTPSVWMRVMEKKLEAKTFDSCMSVYFNEWKFKHPSTSDFKEVVERVSGKNMDDYFSTLTLAQKGGPLIMIDPPLIHNTLILRRKTQLQSFFSFKNTDKYKYIFASPLAGFNTYDKVMIGGMLHNYTLPEEKLQFMVAPLYATGSKKLNGLARIDYKLYQGNYGSKLVLSVAGSSFNMDEFTDSTGKKNYLRFAKVVPALKYVFPKAPKSFVTKYLQWKTFIIQEKTLSFLRDTINDADVITYPTASRYFNQLRFVIENSRVLYPWNAELQAEQGEGFARLSFTGNYFFNYAKGGGMNVRLFAGKFFYLGDKTFRKQFETEIYHLNMTGPKGYEDYGYNNYFIGRNEFDGLGARQIMQRDGFFKVRTDLLSNKIGKTDNWLAAMNFVTTIPKAYDPLQVLPIKIPLKIFVDVGTYAEAWQKEAPTGKFIYDAGLQLSLFKNVLNVYVPLLYSKVYTDYFKSTVPGSRITNNIAFSIDIQNLKLRTLFPQLVF